MTKISESHRMVSTADAPSEPEPGAGPAAKASEFVAGSVATVQEWSNAVGGWLEAKGEALVGDTKSAILSMMDWLPFKEDSPFSTALLKHYVERSGDPYELKGIPPEWQEWIASATQGKVGKFRDLSPYNSGLYDLRNSLGHFDVEVKQNKDGSKTYLLSDTYQFGAMKNDTSQRGRHGFPLGQLTTTELDLLKRALPKDEYMNPGGFKEQWEVKTIGKETFLFIPQAYLAEQGKAFTVSGSFTSR